MRDLRQFPHPPRGVHLTVARTGDRVIISSRQGAPAARLPRPLPGYVFGFLGVWRIAVVALLAVGGLLVLACLLLVLFGDQPLVMNGKPIENRFLAAALVLAILGTFVLIGWIMLSGGTRMNRMMSGETGGWRLELTPDAWTVGREELIRGTGTVSVNPGTIRQISIDADGRLLVQYGSNLLHLTSGLSSETATWLRDVLCRHLEIGN